MKIFSAIDNAEIVSNFFEKTGEKLNVLISYAYLKGSGVKLTRDYRDKIDLLYLDSGAFTEATGKVHISLSEYRRFIRRFGDRFDKVFNLDNNFDNPYHNKQNQIYLEEGLTEEPKRPIPVIHDKVNPLREFKEYVDEGHEYIAIGSNLSRKVFDVIWEDFSGIYIHMFGTLNRKLLFDYKPFSADASTWAKAVGFGKLLYWDLEDKKEYPINLGEREGSKGNVIPFDDFHHKNQLETFLNDKFGTSRTQLMSDYTTKRIVNLYFFKQLENIVNAQSN